MKHNLRFIFHQGRGWVAVEIAFGLGWVGLGCAALRWLLPFIFSLSWGRFGVIVLCQPNVNPMPWGNMQQISCATQRKINTNRKIKTIH